MRDCIIVRHILLGLRNTSRTLCRCYHNPVVMVETRPRSWHPSCNAKAACSSKCAALSQPSHSPLTTLFCVAMCLVPPCCTIPCINAVFSYLRVMPCDIYLLSWTMIATCQRSCFSPSRFIAHNDNCQCSRSRLVTQCS